jgi:ubiquinone/menaquinone biosynthesis C-methylase UbiE
MKERKLHWDKIYATKQSSEMSWSQEYPKTSLDFVHQAHLNKQAHIIDVGGGNSKLVDFLMEEGFENISVLDICDEALKKVKLRLGSKANKVNWIVCDVTEFQPTDTYDFWHDRATFHFLTTEPQIVNYLSTARKAVKENGYVTIGTFSQDGPKKCSGLEVKQYSEEALTSELEDGFEKVKCITEEHETPNHTTQHFLFCSFKRSES